MTYYYETLTRPNYLKFKIRPEDALPVLKTNSDFMDNILECFNSKNKHYFLYFLDGDYWKEQDIWKNNRFIWKVDFQISYDFFEISPFKDGIAQWVDEFILVSPYDISDQIDKVLSSKNFTMTKLIYSSDQMSFKTIALLSRIVRKKKELARGIWYPITTYELEEFYNGNQ